MGVLLWFLKINTADCFAQKRVGGGRWFQAPVWTLKWAWLAQTPCSCSCFYSLPDEGIETASVAGQFLQLSLMKALQEQIKERERKRGLLDRDCLRPILEAFSLIQTDKYMQDQRWSQTEKKVSKVSSGDMLCRIVHVKWHFLKHHFCKLSLTILVNPKAYNWLTFYITQFWNWLTIASSVMTFGTQNNTIFYI